MYYGCQQPDVETCMLLSVIKLSTIPTAFTLYCKTALTEQGNIGKGMLYKTSYLKRCFPLYFLYLKL